MDFLIGGLSAAAAAIFSNPFDVLKTRIQLQGEMHGKDVIYKNLFQAARVVRKNEGLWGLQKGLGAAVTMHAVRNSIRLGTYQWCSRNGYIKDEEGNTIFIRSFLISAGSGVLGAFVGSPLFMIKTQLQSSAPKDIAVGYQHRHTGTLNAVKNIYNDSGLKGLWKGANANMVRSFLGSSSQLTSFALSKETIRQSEKLKEKPVLVSFISSFIGSIIQTIVITPSDIISVRMYNQPVDKEGKGLIYLNALDCMIKIYKYEGFMGYFKGLGANYMRLAPHGVLTLMFWDILKDMQKRYLHTV